MEKIEVIRKVAVHGAPRSGTSWIGEILNSSPNTAYRYQPLFSYAHKDFLTNCSTADDIDSFFERLLHCDDAFTNQIDKRNDGVFPQFQKNDVTHVVYKEVRYMNIIFNLMRKSQDLLLCGIIRNPLSVINSWLQAPREFRRDLGWIEMEEWRYALKKNLNRPEEFHGFEKWKEAANILLALKKRYPAMIHLIEYSRFLDDPLLGTEELFDFVGLDVTEQTRSFLDSSSSMGNANTYAVYRVGQRDDKWKHGLDERICRAICNDLKGTQLERFT